MTSPKESEHPFARRPQEVARTLMASVIARDRVEWGEPIPLQERIDQGLSQFMEKSQKFLPLFTVKPFKPEPEGMHLVASCLGFETVVEVVATHDPMVQAWSEIETRYLLALAINNEIYRTDREIDAYDIAEDLFDTTHFDFIQDEGVIDTEEEVTYFSERNEQLKDALVKLRERVDPSTPAERK